MIARKVTREVLETAANKVGVIAEIEPRGKAYNVKLYPLVTDEQRTKSGRRRSGDAGDAPYQRESAGYSTAGRRVNAVCWHGWRNYFRAVYAETPEAIFRTAIATYRGAAHFEEIFPETGYRNIGPPIAPVFMIDACRCADRGFAS